MPCRPGSGSHRDPAAAKVPRSLRLALCLGALALLAIGCERPDEQPPPEPARPGAAATAPAPAGAVRQASLPDLAFELPEAWTEQKPASSMRVAEYQLPAAGPGAAPATLTVYRFPGGAGGREANIERWLAQVEPPGGQTAREVAVVDTRKVGELSVTTVDVAGTYVAAVRPGAPERHHEPDWRLYAIIVEGAGDPYYFKAIGPAATLARWQPALAELAGSMRAP